MDDCHGRVRLADLVRSPRPFTASASASATPSLPPKPPPPAPPQLPTDGRVLISINRPTLLVGTLSLPRPSSSFSPCSCFRFSDGSASVCCDVLNFHAGAIGKEIRVTACNFIPFKHHEGNGVRSFLEIISWCFSDPNEGSNPMDSLPLVPNCSGSSGGGGSFTGFYGVVESVGPVSVVPCMMATSYSNLNSGPKVNLSGFLVQLVCCECRLCSSKDFINNLKSGSSLFEKWIGNDHSFTKMVIMYFCGNASSWHPALTKLVAKNIAVSGLKKKLVYVTKEESQLLYVTADKSVLHVCPSSENLVPSLKSGIKGKGECGSYTGVIKGVYMQGMALELDHDVWLLLTDQLHTLVHGLRVGTIISVTNVHFVDPKFSWTKVIIVGACIKTSIIVESFSPLETVCNSVLQSNSKLGKFIQSLPFSARLWVLLLVSSLRKKFAGILSDKEILGSKHKEGLAQVYASSLLPPSEFQNKHGAILDLFRHDLSGCGRELNCSFLKLVLPMSVFNYHCVDTLLRMLKSESHCKLLPVDHNFSILSSEARYNGRSVRRIIPSEDVGVILLGYLKIDPSTRRLQLVDATGGIDVLIPDLPLSWNPNEIYEVMDYDVFVDGIGELVDQLELLDREPLSCRMIFNCTLAERALGTSLFVSCHWGNVQCKKLPLYSCVKSNNEAEILEPGSYHLLRVSHKFPPQEKDSNNMGSNNSITFVEAIILPCTLLLARNTEISHPGTVSEDKTMEIPKYTISGCNEEQVSMKRQKLAKESESLMEDDLHTSIFELSACSNSFRKLKENTKCVDLSSSHDICCLVTFRSLQKENLVYPAVLCSTAPMKPTSRKIFLEFSSDRFLKYQLLQVGGHYIVKHAGKDCFAKAKDTCFGSSGSAKFLLDSGKHIWSLSFISDEVLNSTSAKDSSPAIDRVLPNDQIEQLLLSSNNHPSGVFSDCCLYLPSNYKGLLEDNIMESEDSADISLSTRTVMAWRNICSELESSNCLFPEGDLISLEGDVVDIHDVGSSFCNSCSSGASLEALRLKGLFRTRSSFCIHVLVHHHIVNVIGSINENSFPTGFGPGVTAMFRRVLTTRAQNKFMLLPVSFIAIKSIKVYDKQCSDRSSNLRPTKDAYGPSQDTCLIYQLPQCSIDKQIVLRCRVVAIFVLVIEWKTTNFDRETKNNANGSLLDIPLAAFLLDDGSSSCCCWANAERAATLLGLHEEVNTSNHLGRILKNCKRITVKNHGPLIDSPYQDLLVSVASGDELCSSDENLLKFIIFNACVGRIWNVVANVMDAEEVMQLEKEYPTEMGNMQTMQNLRAKEVSSPRNLTEARNMIQQLVKS